MMTDSEVRQKIAEFLAQITENVAVELNDTMVAADVTGWDSGNHVKLMMAIEEELGVRFDVEELGAPENVGALVKLVSSKIGK